MNTLEISKIGNNDPENALILVIENKPVNYLLPASVLCNTDIIELPLKRTEAKKWAMGADCITIRRRAGISGCLKKIIKKLSIIFHITALKYFSIIWTILDLVF
jgi:hypothetical protein